MRSQRFGIEMEMTGITRKKAVEVIAAYFDTHEVHDGGSYDARHVTDGQGRRWKVVSDASIHPAARDGRSASTLYKVEVVSPICHYEDIETIQELVRKLRRAGACVNDSCGIHIHVDAAPHSAKTLRNLVNIMVSKEDLLYKALAVDVAREDHYCQKTDLRFLEELNRKKPKSIESFERMWYQGESRRYMHYDNSRYRALNLHSVFSKGTIEFRLFNRGTLRNSTFKGNQAGSLPQYSFHYSGLSDTIYFFEAPLDMLSYISLQKENWRAHSYAAACSVSDQVLFYQLKLHENLKKCVLCLDNDLAGYRAGERICEKLLERGYEIEVDYPRKKDWNEELLQRQEQEKERAICPAMRY